MAEPMTSQRLNEIRADLTWLIKRSGLTAADVGMFLDPPVSNRAVHFWTEAGQINDEHRNQIRGLANRLRNGAELAAARQRIDALTSAAVVEATAREAFWSDDIGGHHKPGPSPHTWENIPEQGRENYRILVRAVLSVVMRALTGDGGDDANP